MSNRIDSFSRRKFLATTALGAVAATIAMPSVLRAQGAGVKLGVLQPLETYEATDDTYVSLMRRNLEELKKAMQ